MSAGVSSSSFPEGSFSGCYPAVSGHGPSFLVSPSLPEKSQGQAVLRVIPSIQLSLHFDQRPPSLSGTLPPFSVLGSLGGRGNSVSIFFLVLLLGSVTPVEDAEFSFVPQCSDGAGQSGSGKPALRFTRASGRKLSAGAGTAWGYGEMAGAGRWKLGEGRYKPWVSLVPGGDSCLL